MLVGLLQEPYVYCGALFFISVRVLAVPHFVHAVVLAVFVFIAELQWLMSCLFFLVQVWALVSDILHNILEFAAILTISSIDFVRWATGGMMPKVTTFEVAALLLVLLRLTRLVCGVVEARYERHLASLEIKERLSDVLRNPFYAKVSDACPCPSQMVRASSYSCRLECDDSTLSVKHALLVTLRQQEAGRLGFKPRCLSLVVRRDFIVQDSWRILSEIPAANFLAMDRMSVSYVGELGVDGGGLTRDWFYTLGLLLGEGSEKDNAFSALALGHCTRMLIPRPFLVADRNEGGKDRLHELVLVGRFLALGAVFGGQPLPVALSVLICKYILGLTVLQEDVRDVDPEFFRVRVMPLFQEGGVAEMEVALGEPLTFVSAPTQLFPSPVELLPGGASQVVTNENVKLYVRLLSEAYLCSEIRQQVECLCRGFWDVLPPSVLLESGITPQELGMLLSGTPGLSLFDWRQHAKEAIDDHCVLSKEAAEQVVSHFWLVVDGMDDDQRRNLLRFVTGSGRLPVGGFASLNPPFTIVVTTAGSPDHLPLASTCLNRLTLYASTSFEQMRTKLLQATTTCRFEIA